MKTLATLLLALSLQPVLADLKACYQKCSDLNDPVLKECEKIEDLDRRLTCIKDAVNDLHYCFKDCDNEPPLVE